MRKVRITIRVSRYQKEKMWGELYRHESVTNETFTNFKKRKLEEKKKKKKKMNK